MKRLIFPSLLLAAFACIQPNETSAQSDNNKQAVHMTAEEIKWEAIPGGVGGAMRSQLWEDASTGAYGGFTKFPAGFKAPMHYHTNDMKLVVVKGAYMYNGKKYGPGSYLFIPGGDKHESGGAANSETVFFIEQPGKFDINMLEQQK